MTLGPGTLAHVYPAGLEVELGLDHRVAPGEQRALDGRAVELGLDGPLPVPSTGGRSGGHISGQN